MGNQSVGAQNQGPAWPKSAWNIELGSIVRGLRQRKKTMSSEKHELLDAVGFVWKVYDFKCDSSSPPKIPLDHQQMILEVAQFFRGNSKSWTKTHGQNTYVGLRLTFLHFVVPINKAVKQGRLDPLIVAELDKIGFVWNCLEHHWQLNVEALILYVVPNKDPTWPVYLWKKKLGAVVHNIRTHKNSMPSDRCNDLSAIGFVWETNGNARLLNLKGLKIYHRLFRHVLMP
ncbi:Aste57867_1477 [Aphanomyces stellatus]|uniref:Aste57867_1477 protein n=1 Tax=Aphanomyces stellatus TaxID=120398 RepID=A0A485K568_9STRA|nr:hypothetical protein As57867_001476 [Aphanomyces stellatus]VFT78693.1 Aste57867_1477 [Aphanomyces stellatus]